MPRVNHVKRAQQRYATKPVIDPATGEQKVVPVINKRTGEQKVSKHGRPVFLRVTERDLERPKPMPQCDYPECKHESREIAVGTPYKWIEPSGQGVRNRHADCPTWQPWEYSSALWARIAQIQADGIPDFDSPDDYAQWAADKAQEIRDLAEEKRESAENIVEGFGHETYQSEELEQTADELERWADDLEGVDIPEPEESPCGACEGTGRVDAGGDGVDSDEEEPCTECDGTGHNLDEWRDNARSAVEDLLNESPV